MYYYDPTYILVLIGALISAIASWNVNHTFEKYNRAARTGLTGRDAAERILQAAGIHDVRIEPVQGRLSDHYSPKDKVLRLSQSVYNSRSIAAIGVAAHECGHAIQHQQDYLPLKMRSLSVPAANFGSWLSWPLILQGDGSVSYNESYVEMNGNFASRAAADALYLDQYRANYTFTEIPMPRMETA